MLKRIYRWLNFIFTGFVLKDRYSGKIIEKNVFLEQINVGNVNDIEIGKLYIYAELKEPIGKIFKTSYVRVPASSVRGSKEIEKLTLSNRTRVLKGI